MCGRTRYALGPQQVPETAGVPPERWRDPARYKPDNNVCPGHYTPVIRLGEDALPELHTMKYGQHAASQKRCCQFGDGLPTPTQP